MTERVLPIYERMPEPTDAIGQKYPHLFEVRIEDVSKVDLCDGWIAQVRAPTKRHPPYYEDNHHFEYWGVLENAEYQLGRGQYFSTRQDIDVNALAYFLAHACEGPPGEETAALTYLRLVLAGRFPFASAGAPEPRMWHWIDHVGQLPDEWVSEVQKAGAVPPQIDARSSGSEYRACVIAQVGQDHIDVGCWMFQFDANRRFLAVEQIFRRQSVPGFPSDSNAGSQD